ncbi:MAG: PDZ domain-containing protein [Deltaproteobacteria bacterium]|nr:PDZ domain-containing protein [Deltaproteobacteria bacterium]
MKHRSITLVSCAWLLLVALAGSLPAQGSKTWSANDDMQLYYEAADKITKSALSPVSLRQVVQGSLKSYLKSFDEYAEYLTPEEYTKYKQGHIRNFSGVGMDIHPNKQGEIVCLPYPQSPAALAGLQSGDILQEVNGQPVTGMTAPVIRDLIIGPAGTRVRLKIARPAAQALTIEVNRAPVTAQTVLVSYLHQIPVVKIVRFTNYTLTDLKAALAGLIKA